MMGVVLFSIWRGRFLEEFASEEVSPGAAVTGGEVDAGDAGAFFFLTLLAPRILV